MLLQAREGLLVTHTYNTTSKGAHLLHVVHGLAIATKKEYCMQSLFQL